MLGVAVSFTSIVISCIILYCIITEKDKNTTKKVITSIFAGIPTILSIVYLAGDLEETKTGIKNSFHWGYIILFWVVAFILIKIASDIRYKEAKEQEKTELQDAGVLSYTYTILITGIYLPPGTSCRLLILKDFLLIEGANTSFKIISTQLKGAYVNTQKEIIEKENNVIGRAVIGGVALGSIGAIVGALSGVAPKIEEVNHYLLTVVYVNSNGENSAIVFRKGIAQNSFERFKHLEELNKFAEAVNGIIQNNRRGKFEYL